VRCGLLPLDQEVQATCQRLGARPAAAPPGQHCLLLSPQDFTVLARCGDSPATQTRGRNFA